MLGHATSLLQANVEEVEPPLWPSETYRSRTGPERDASTDCRKISLPSRVGVEHRRDRFVAGCLGSPRILGQPTRTFTRCRSREVCGWPGCGVLSLQFDPRSSLCLGPSLLAGAPQHCRVPANIARHNFHLFQHGSRTAMTPRLRRGWSWSARRNRGVRRGWHLSASTPEVHPMRRLLAAVFVALGSAVVAVPAQAAPFALGPTSTASGLVRRMQTSASSSLPERRGGMRRPQYPVKKCFGRQDQTTAGVPQLLSYFTTAAPAMLAAGSGIPAVTKSGATDPWLLWGRPPIRTRSPSGS